MVSKKGSHIAEREASGGGRGYGNAKEGHERKTCLHGYAGISVPEDGACGLWTLSVRSAPKGTTPPARRKPTKPSTFSQNTYVLSNGALVSILSLVANRLNNIDESPKLVPL
ncbi:hypothetical protein K0M31_003646 [Melipona bicolor]|uniref:Uncharacterized protein n=1 Tax=Melipona bicolor TaxID=60889 RepID=A0AA40FZL0_9HYME|nr:hypothetical protein K0M31_003646 [Melipona bicolor]